LSLSKTLGLAGALTLAFVVHAAVGCGGAEFASDAGGGGSQAGAAVLPGEAGAGMGGAKGSLAGCRGPEDCDDEDACTVDVCRADGVCVLSALCAASERCCDGDCGECCDNGDCDDGVACTSDACFAGTCVYVPDTERCGASSYCSLTQDCQAQEPCQGEGDPVCDDGSLCTTDACGGGLCSHAFCEQATQCCPAAGCAEECCSNQECDTDDDPCTIGVCSGGKCSQAPRCGESEQCCVQPSGAATCGGCCSASDCDDSVDCTVDACIEGRCSSAPGSCPTNQTCDPASGCKQNIECTRDDDCESSACGRCDEGTCSYGCGAGLVCCGNVCQACCSQGDCQDGIACTTDACTNGVCKFTPNNQKCPLLQHCSIPQRGCALL